MHALHGVTARSRMTNYNISYNRVFAYLPRGLFFYVPIVINGPKGKAYFGYGFWNQPGGIVKINIGEHGGGNGRWA